MIVLIGGVSGTGKTTVGVLLARRLNWRFADGDSFHPAANIAKMRAGVPLTDADRWPWLRAIGCWADQRIAAGESAVIACSLLKRGYRSLLLAGRPAVRLAFLTASRDLLHARLAARHGHFFSAKLLDSQFADLELPQPAEGVLVLAAAEPAAVLADEIIDGLHLTAAPAAGPATVPGMPNASGEAAPVHRTAEIYPAARQEKPWGYELIFAVVSDKYAGKVIHVNAGHSLSLQYHREKEETISVLDGEALIEYGPAADQLTAQRFRSGDTIHLPPGALHRVVAVSDVTFVEASTAGPGWRDDVVRLEDRYGRTGTSAP